MEGNASAAPANSMESTVAGRAVKVLRQGELFRVLADHLEDGGAVIATVQPGGKVIATTYGKHYFGFAGLGAAALSQDRFWEIVRAALDAG